MDYMIWSISSKYSCFSFGSGSEGFQRSLCRWNCIWLIGCVHFLMSQSNGCFCNLLKGFGNSLAIFGADLEMLDLRMHLHKLHDVCCVHLPLLLKVTLVADQHKWKILRSRRTTLLHELSHPTFNILKTLDRCKPYAALSDVINKDACITSSVKGSTHRSESFLASCVPNLCRRKVTSKSTAFPSTITSFSEKSAPIVTL